MEIRWSQIWAWTLRRRWPLFLSAIAIVLPLIVYILPPILARPEGFIREAERLRAENDVRNTLLQALGGALLFAGLYVTWRTFDLNRQGHDLAREGQITDRFTRAVDQLGSENVDVRLGGIYALERLAKSSEVDHWTIMEVLTAYVRQHAPLVNERPEAKRTSGEEPGPPVDIQAVLTVLGRTDRRRDPPGSSLNLQAVNLRGADLHGVDLCEVNLRWSDLSWAEIWKANLRGANLRNVSMRFANLGGANLEGADLGGADLSGTNLTGTSLVGATLGGTNLGAGSYEGLKTAGATYDSLTKWPDEYDYRQAGAIHKHGAIHGQGATREGP